MIHRQLKQNSTENYIYLSYRNVPSDRRYGRKGYDLCP